MFDLPDSNTGKSSARQKHRHIYSCSLYDDGDCDQNTEHQHIASSSKFVTQEDSDHRADSFASNVGRYNLSTSELQARLGAE